MATTSKALRELEAQGLWLLPKPSWRISFWTRPYPLSDLSPCLRWLNWPDPNHQTKELQARVGIPYRLEQFLRPSLRLDWSVSSMLAGRRHQNDAGICGWGRFLGFSSLMKGTTLRSKPLPASIQIDPGFLVLIVRKMNAGQNQFSIASLASK